MNSTKGTTIVWALALPLILFAMSSSASMSSASYQIPNDVIGAGGNSMSSASYQLDSTLGQPSPLGTATSTGYTNYPGFWQADECVFDPDADGLTNAEEYGYITDPYLFDTDGDTLGDGEEVTSGDDGYITDPLLYDTDGDSLGDGGEYAAGTNPLNTDTDADGVGDGAEVNSACMNALYWDSDGDALPDGYEYLHAASSPPLDACSVADGSDDFDNDKLENVHEYYNGTDPWAFELDNSRHSAGCFYWTESGVGNGILGPEDIAEFQGYLVSGSANYESVIPPSVDVQELSADGIPDPTDLSIIQAMILGQSLDDVKSRPAAMEVIDTPAASIEVGSTTHATLHLLNEAGLYTSGFGIVFSVNASSTGSVTLLGGDGDDVSGRYDFTSFATDAPSRIVLRADTPGTVYLDASIPACGIMPLGKSAPAVSIAAPFEIVVQ